MTPNATAIITGVTMSMVRYRMAGLSLVMEILPSLRKGAHMREEPDSLRRS